MVIPSALHPALLPSLPNPDTHLQLRVSQTGVKDCLVKVTACLHVMLEVASEACGRL